ncbi:tetratricopeptide repeat-containing glycosyltransferase family 2 protein [Clostridium folliculivorans]|uniref:Glycosyl transferase n=1 Tax=Clostridium folliculivorans TaxID=2886038 RepID=A0A9W5Y3W4_9CLOT|nr:TPR domain-containing glycosyltransferase [Clostridium folliculivorans]GKU25992.1 glycosyl transferase [Clostridium folliculivorans]GKU28078.1 glycosyl transferase [Clostridium folliculivorans]
MKNEISLCMIVKNEEEYLPRCLNSVKDIVDEIIVVDTGSTDRTIEIAKEFNAKVYSFQWSNNFSEARNESLKHATKDWILILDADEEIYKEDQELFITLFNSELDENAIYNFEGVSYSGNYIDENNKTVNLNPRLFKNNMGIHYESAIHNQLVSSENNYNVICEDVKIHHYGYLNERIISTDKRNRNLTILKEQFKENPNDKFICFNLGNEYAALGDLKKALEFYYKAYDKFEPNTGYGFALVIRMVYTHYTLGEYYEALNLSDEGIKYYPYCTDLHFFKAEIFKALRKPTLQIKALQKCIEIGEAPANLKFFSGTGGFKAYYELGNVCSELRDYEGAYNYYVEAMKAEAGFITPIYDIIHILKLQSLKVNEVQEIIKRFFSDSSEDCSMMTQLFFKEGYYEAALECLGRCRGITLTDEMKAFKLKCLIRIGNYEECIAADNFNEETKGYSECLMYKIISYILIGKCDKAKVILDTNRDTPIYGYDKKVIEVCRQLVNLFTKEPTSTISKDENETEYMNIILEVWEIILINRKYDELAVAVNLANLVDNRFALLELGKLYYRNGYIEIAKREILRSIKEFEIYDNEGLDILKI